MKIKIAILLIIFSAFVATVSAQERIFPGKGDPIETTFSPDSTLFAELLSEFPICRHQYDTIWAAEWVNSVSVGAFLPLDTKYEKIVMSVHFHQAYPAFRIDCPHGYALGIFHRFLSKLSNNDYLDILSFDLKGRIMSRVSFSFFHLDHFMLDDTTQQDSQLLSGIDIMNGELPYGFTQQDYIYRTCHFETKKKYLYKIQDDATLKLISMEPQED